MDSGQDIITGLIVQSWVCLGIETSYSWELLPKVKKCLKDY